MDPDAKRAVSFGIFLHQFLFVSFCFLETDFLVLASDLISVLFNTVSDFILGVKATGSVVHKQEKMIVLC